MDDQEKDKPAFTQPEHPFGLPRDIGGGPGDPKKDISFGSGEFLDQEGAPLIVNPYFALRKRQTRPSLFDYLKPTYSWERPQEVEKNIEESLFWFKVWPSIASAFGQREICDMCGVEPAKFRVKLIYTSGKTEQRLLCVMCDRAIEAKVKEEERRERRRNRGR